MCISNIKFNISYQYIFVYHTILVIKIQHQIMNGTFPDEIISRALTYIYTWSFLADPGRMYQIDTTTDP